MLQTHSHAQLIAIQFARAEMLADVNTLRDLIDDRCIFTSYMGVVQGKNAVLNAFADAKRHQFNKRHFTKFVQVQHCLDAELSFFSEAGAAASPSNDDFEEGGASFLGATPLGGESEAPQLRSPFNSHGFDSQGFAQFERDGDFSVDVRGSARKVDLKETIVINSKGLIVLVVRARRP